LTTDLPDISVIYVDDSLLVMNKPSGLLSVPGRGDDKQDCLSVRAQRHYPDAVVVHRLDMATSGLMVMTRSVASQRSLSQAFAERRVHKRYEAVVDGLPSAQGIADVDGWHEIDLPIFLHWPNRPKRVIDAVLGKPSKTRWQVISSNITEQTSRLALEPVTGRSHQLRVHLLAIHHPILGDALYAPAAIAAKSSRLLLHATQLDFIHPVSLQAMHFVSPAPF